MALALRRPVAALALLATAARAQQLTNTGFEADAVATYTYQTPTGWLAGGGVVVIPSGSAPWGGLETTEGSHYCAVQGSGSFVEQAVLGLTAGSAYDVNFLAAERPGYGADESTYSGDNST